MSSPASAPPSLRPVRGAAAQVLGLLREWEEAPDPGPLAVDTSGSTGRAKRVLLSRAAMRASADATHARLGGPGRWELNLPATYVAGVQVLYRSVRAGLDPVLPGEQDGERAGGGPRAHRRYVSVVPTQLVRALREPGATAALTAYDAVLVGGGPLAPGVRAAAEQAGIRVVQTYGMSETCGGCVYDGRPLDGVRVRVDENGQVLLGGAVLFDGYAGEPERTARALCDGMLRTHDRGHWEGDRLRIDGRLDDVAVSGGVNVPLSAVAAAVAAHPAVSEAAVVGVPDEEWGERVVAVVVPRGGVELAELRDLVRPRAWAPRQLVLVEELPLLGTGKPDRVALRELARG